MARIRNIMRNLMLLMLVLMLKGVESTRPEQTFLNILSMPFAPAKLNNASSECLRDSLVYLDALKEYSPWALQSACCPC